MAVSNGFVRFQADTLTQIGEVLRCQGEHQEARTQLREACSLADRLGLDIVKGFALSALGANEYDSQGDLTACKKYFMAADTIFYERQHAEGLALNLRRYAVLLRRLFASNRSDKEPYEQARWMLDRAKKDYENRRSPAGLVACHVGYCRLNHVAGYDDKDNFNSIVALVRDGDDRQRIVRDPWVPTMVLTYASSVGETDLAELATALVRDGVQLDIEPVPKNPTGLGNADDLDSRVDLSEMAGEPRRWGLSEMAGEPRRSLEPV